MRLGSFLHSVVAWPLAVAATVVFASLAVVARPLSPGGRVGLYVGRWWARVILVIAAVRLRVEGAGNLDLSRRYVIMVNHESALDIPALMAALPARLRTRFLAKKSLFSLPFLGWAMRALGFIPVDRADRSTAPEMFRKASDRARGGSSLLVFPEETRTEDGRLLPFQRGGFLLALRSRYPILPVGLEGSRVALPSGSRLLRPLTRITVRIGRPIETEGRSTRERQALMDETRRAIDRLRGPTGHVPDPGNGEGPGTG